MFKNIVKRVLSPPNEEKQQYDKRLYDPIIILQPGKVGSLSVKYSLEEHFKKLKLQTPIYHAHALNKLDERESFVKGTRKNPVSSLKLIKEWKELRHSIDTKPEKHWNIISLVRDPVAIKVSALFQVLEQHIPDWESRYKNNNLPISEIQELFSTKQEFGFTGLDKWFDIQVRDLWNIDIYATPFPTEKGYQIYTDSSQRVRLLVIRLEDLNQVAAQAFQEFLGTDGFAITSVNVGEEKPYRELYKEFKSQPFPENVVKQAYETKYAQHFYSAEELSQFRKKWLRN